LFAAAKGVEGHPAAIISLTEAGQAKGVGPMVLKDLQCFGVPAAVSKRERILMDGMATIYPNITMYLTVKR